MKFDCEFLFAALAEKHNAVIRKIREIPPWEWGEEFLELEPQVLRFLSAFAKQLGISVDMVKKHMNALMQKMNAANRSEAVAIALRKQLLKI